VPQADSTAVADAYAKALLELAQERQQLDEVADECLQLGEMLDHNADFQTLITSPMIKPEQRRGVLDRLFAGKVTDTLYHFLLVLNRKQRIASLPAVLMAFGRELNALRGVTDVTAITAEAMPDDQAEAIKARLTEQLDGRTIHLNRQTDPDLIGGLALRVGDTLIDGSVATRLQRMKRQMIDAGREKARQTVETADERGTTRMSSNPTRIG
jgi:F-type H+-transporting ATPase subunit delta